MSSHSTRILLYTGKGGVGKTTLAAASALHAAKQGVRTLVLSTDPAHSLADALDQPLGPEPQLLRPNLEAMEVDLYYSMSRHWDNLRKLLFQVFKWQGVDQVAAEELAALPGMEEASALLWIDDFYQEAKYDLIIVDSAPTGETLTFLTLPQTLQWWLQRAFPGQRLAIRTSGAWLRTMTGIPLDKGLEELERLYEKLSRVQKLMSNPEISSIRIVLNPERMVLREAQRAYAYLQIYGYPVDAVMVNRVFPETEGETFLKKYLAAQKTYLREIEDSFAPLPVWQVPHLGEEVYGLTLLERIGQALYGDRNPADIFHQETLYRLEQHKDHYTLSIRAPFMTGDDLNVKQFGDEIVIRFSNRQRNLFLPKFLSYYTIDETQVAEGWLTIRFIKPSP